MKNFYTFWLIIFILFSCKQNDCLLSPNPEGRYSYVSYDQNGNLIVEGWLTINITDSSKIDGKWDLEKV